MDTVLNVALNTSWGSGSVTVILLISAIWLINTKVKHIASLPYYISSPTPMPRDVVEGDGAEYALCVSHVRLLYALRRALLSLVVSDKINEAVACYLYFSSFLSYLGFLFVCFISNYFVQRLKFYKSVLRIIQKRRLTMFIWIRWVTLVGSHR